MPKIKQDYSVGCVPPARYHMGEGVSLTQTPRWTETSLDRDFPGQGSLPSADKRL